MISPAACGALFSARTTPQPSQNFVEPRWNPRGTLPQGRPGPPRSLSGLRHQSFQLLGKKERKREREREREKRAFFLSFFLSFFRSFFVCLFACLFVCLFLSFFIISFSLSLFLAFFGPCHKSVKLCGRLLVDGRYESATHTKHPLEKVPPFLRQS